MIPQNRTKDSPRSKRSRPSDMLEQLKRKKGRLILKYGHQELDEVITYQKIDLISYQKIYQTGEKVVT
eukprot:UN21078